MRSERRYEAATGDAFGVFLVGVPLSSKFSGEKEGQVAISRVRVQAIQSSIKAKGCKYPTMVCKFADPCSEDRRPQNSALKCPKLGDLNVPNLGHLKSINLVGPQLPYVPHFFPPSLVRSCIHAGSSPVNRRIASMTAQ